VIILLTRPLTLSMVRFISEDRHLGGLFHELGEEIGWEILEMRQLLRFLKDFLKKNAKKFGGFKIK
jgi:hypothetical protein